MEKCEFLLQAVNSLLEMSKPQVELSWNLMAHSDAR
jgi:hypothetical protein